MPDAEAALMGRYCDGEAAAFHALHSLLAGKVLAYLVSLVGDRAAAEDLLQQTFMKLHQNRSTYVRGADPVPWIYTIAHRTCLDELRRRKRSRVKLVVGDAPAPEQKANIVGAPTEDGEVFAPTADGDGTDRARAALAALERLPEKQREALVLTKLHGRSVAEAAAITGSTPGAIKLRTHRAYLALREVLGVTTMREQDVP